MNLLYIYFVQIEIDLIMVVYHCDFKNVMCVIQLSFFLMTKSCNDTHLKTFEVQHFYIFTLCPSLQTTRL